MARDAGAAAIAEGQRQEREYLAELRAARESGARVPDFFLVGHAKCGTTAMYRMLDPHPEIFMPLHKETQFLSRAPYERAAISRRREPVRPQTLEAYLALFAGADPALCAGEASTEYLRTPSTAARIQALCPEARIVAAFREPASFVRSLHLQLLEIGIEDEPDLRRALALEHERREGRALPPSCPWPPALQYTSHVRYAEQLRGYRDLFGAERVMTIVYDDFRADNEGDDAGDAPLPRRRRQRRDRAARGEPDRARPLAPGRGGAPVGLRGRRPARSRRARRPAPRQHPEARRRALRAARSVAVDSAPAPADEALMSELRERFAGEVALLGELLGRDLPALWGYERAARPTRRQRGGIRSAPSSRIVSPLSIRFSTMWQASCAYSAGWPRRRGNGTPAPSAARCSSGSAASSGVSNRPGAIVLTRIPYWLRSRAAGSVMPTTPPLEAE